MRLLCHKPRLQSDAPTLFFQKPESLLQLEVAVRAAKFFVPYHLRPAIADGTKEVEVDIPATAWQQLQTNSRKALACSFGRL